MRTGRSGVDQQTVQLWGCLGRVRCGQLARTAIRASPPRSEEGGGPVRPCILARGEVPWRAVGTVRSGASGTVAGLQTVPATSRRRDLPPPDPAVGIRPPESAASSVNVCSPLSPADSSAGTRSARWSGAGPDLALRPRRPQVTTPQGLPTGKRCHPAVPRPQRLDIHMVLRRTPASGHSRSSVSSCHTPCQQRPTRMTHVITPGTRQSSRASAQSGSHDRREGSLQYDSAGPVLREETRRVPREPTLDSALAGAGQPPERSAGRVRRHSPPRSERTTRTQGVHGTPAVGFLSPCMKGGGPYTARSRSVLCGRDESS
jgi:hypothetical protein